MCGLTVCLADVVVWVLHVRSVVELEEWETRRTVLACPITTALTASSGVNRDHEYMSLAVTNAWIRSL